jgi:hypothetical protein
MKNIFYLLTGVTLFVSCSSDPSENKDDSKKPDTIALFKTDSTAKKYNDPNLPPSEEYTGDHIVKYDNGITRFRGFFRFGKKHGTWAAFFPTGELQSETEFDNGIRTGKVKVYYPNGKLMYDGFFKSDNRTGTWHTYDTTGKLIEEKKY